MVFSSVDLPSQDQGGLIAHDPPVAVHQGQTSVPNLTVAADAPQLSYCLGNVRHTSSQARLTPGQLAAMSVTGEFSLEGEVSLLHERTTLPFGTESGILKGNQYRYSVAVIERDQIHVAWF
jgi:hypothetical protein